MNESFMVSLWGDLVAFHSPARNVRIKFCLAEATVHLTNIYVLHYTFTHSRVITEKDPVMHCDVQAL